MNTLAATELNPTDLQQRVERFHLLRDRILEQVRKVIVGQDEVLDQILIALFVGGHCLITGLPGTSKTLMVRTIATTLGLQFRRIQFTPDLMPSILPVQKLSKKISTPDVARGLFLKGPSS